MQNMVKPLINMSFHHIPIADTLLTNKILLDNNSLCNAILETSATSLVETKFSNDIVNIDQLSTEIEDSVMNMRETLINL